MDSPTTSGAAGSESPAEPGFYARPEPPPGKRIVVAILQGDKAVREVAIPKFFGWIREAEAKYGTLESAEAAVMRTLRGLMRKNP